MSWSTTLVWNDDCRHSPTDCFGTDWHAHDHIMADFKVFSKGYLRSLSGLIHSLRESLSNTNRINNSRFVLIIILLLLSG